MKKILGFSFWSNAFFLAPLLFSMSYRMWAYSVVMGLALVVSLLFHFKKDIKIGYLDVLISSMLMISNLILLFKGHWVTPYSLVAIAFAIVAIVFYSRQFKYGYGFNHGLWHFFSAGTSLFCIATFMGL
ncbi:MAG: hypothetical protein AAB895_02075 [Patescibacteria group bacterium]